MMRLFYIIFALLLFTACDDGDILTIELDFEGELERCDNNEEYYTIYDTREDPNEALILIIERDDTNELLFTQPTEEDTPIELLIDESSTRFIYRTYNRAIEDEELCDVIPASDLIAIDDYEANSGTVQVTVTVEDDDNDGIPSDDEGRGELDENGEYSNALDSDNDGIPDYLDQDDDNDNVLTEDEIDNEDLDGDDDPLTNPLDTDNDGIPNYLDDDDDNDGTLTILEDEDGSNGPIDDFVIDTDGNTVVRYLYAGASDSYTNPGYIYNTYTRYVTTTFTIINAGLDVINSTIIDFGTYESSFEITNEPEDD